MDKRYKIMFVIPSLRPGGAERVMSYIASQIDPEKFISTLVVIGSEKDKAYDVYNINVIFLNKKKVRNGFLPLLKLIVRNRYNVCMSSIGHVNTMMSVYALFFWKTIFIGRETIVRSNRPKTKGKSVLSILSHLQKYTLNKVICQSKDMYIDMLENFGFKKDRLVIINNAITNKFVLKKPVDNNIKQFITIGRLSKQKGYERILRCLKDLDFPFRYTIIGSGSEEDAITKLIKSYNLQDKIEHIPFTKEIEFHLSKSDCYLQGSYVEGFPNALLESCAVGTPVVAYDAPGGINEIVMDGVNGYIAYSDTDFKDKIYLSIEREWDLHGIRNSVTSRYSKDIIIAQYEDLFMNVINK